VKKRYMHAGRLAEAEWKALCVSEPEQNYYTKSGYDMQGYTMDFEPNEKFLETLSARLGSFSEGLPCDTDVFAAITHGVGNSRNGLVLSVSHGHLEKAVAVTRKLEREVVEALRAEKLAACMAGR